MDKEEAHRCVKHEIQSRIKGTDLKERKGYSINAILTTKITESHKTLEISEFR